MVGIATLLSVPLGIATAVFLNEIGGFAGPSGAHDRRRDERDPLDRRRPLHLRRVHHRSSHQQQTGFAAALALAVLMLPTVTRTAEVVLRLVPGGLREASLALGGGEWATMRRIMLPTARTGLLTAVILGIARVVGETAPLILTSLGNTSFNGDPFQGKQDALPLFVYRLIRFPQAASIQRAWTGALVLLGLVLVLFIIARIIGGRGPGHIGRISGLRLARKGSRVSSSEHDGSGRRRARPSLPPNQAAELVTEDVERVVRRPQGAAPREPRRCSANQVTALIGPSGCGKSTFLRILNRMHELVPERVTRRERSRSTASTSTAPTCSSPTSAGASGWCSRSRTRSRR